MWRLHGEKKKDSTTKSLSLEQINQLSRESFASHLSVEMTGSLCDLVAIASKVVWGTRLLNNVSSLFSLVASATSATNRRFFLEEKYHYFLFHFTRDENSVLQEIVDWKEKRFATNRKEKKTIFKKAIDYLQKNLVKKQTRDNVKKEPLWIERKQILYKADDQKEWDLFLQETKNNYILISVPTRVSFLIGIPG